PWTLGDMAARVGEAIWLNGFILSRKTQLPQGYGKEKSMRRARDCSRWRLSARFKPVLSHPDYDRRLRSYTGSADPRDVSPKALAGLALPPYRRWGVTPRPENECRNCSLRLG